MLLLGLYRLKLQTPGITDFWRCRPELGIGGDLGIADHFFICDLDLHRPYESFDLLSLVQPNLRYILSMISECITPNLTEKAGLI